MCANREPDAHLAQKGHLKQLVALESVYGGVSSACLLIALEAGPPVGNTLRGAWRGKEDKEVQGRAGISE